MPETKSDLKALITKISLVILAIAYAYSFFLPAAEYHGNIYGYELFKTPAIIAAVIPNTLVILTLVYYLTFTFKKKSFFHLLF